MPSFPSSLVLPRAFRGGWGFKWQICTETLVVLGLELYFLRKAEILEAQRKTLTLGEVRIKRE